MLVTITILLISVSWSLLFALFIAPSLVVVLGRGRGKTWGIYIHDKNVIPNSNKIKTVVFSRRDLTESEPKVTDIISFSEYPSETVWDLVAEAIQESAHLLGADTTTVVGERTITMGHGDYLLKNSVIQDGAFDRGLGKALSLASEGKMIVHLAENGRYVGLIALHYPQKPLSRKGVRSLRAMGIRTVMISDEEERTANAIGKSMGIDRVIAETRFQDSAVELEKFRSSGKTAVIIGSTEATPFQPIGDFFPIILMEPSDIQNDAWTPPQKNPTELALSHRDSTDIAMALSYLKRLNSVNVQNLFFAFLVGIVTVLYGIAGGRPSFPPLLLSFLLGPVLMVLNILRIGFFHLPSLNLGEKENGAPPNTINKILTIDGMSCGHCTIKVKSALEDVPGITRVSIDLITKKARIAGSGISDKDLQEAVTRAGYRLTGILG